MNQRPIRAGSSQVVRSMNAGTVLSTMWEGEPVTASDLMQSIGLTRATVLALCKDLVAEGWLLEVENSRDAGAYKKGRPSLRYVFNARKKIVVGVDAGQHRLKAAVADLAGTALGTAQISMGHGWGTPEQRRCAIVRTVDQALDDAGLSPSDVDSVVFGVPAPVDLDGLSPEGPNEYWRTMNPGLNRLMDDRGWLASVENDANLAAFNELHRDPGLRDSSFAALLVGQRYGAGIVLNSQLLRQRRGNAGELEILHLVDGVGTPDGAGHSAQTLAVKAIQRAAAGTGPTTSLSMWSEESVRAEHVFAMADQGDDVARGIVEKVADQIARVCALLAGPLGLDGVVISGGMAPALSGLTASIQRSVQRYLYAPWLTVSASASGADAVRDGAVFAAIEGVQKRALRGL